MTRGKRKLFWIAPAAILGIALFIFIGGEIVMQPVELAAADRCSAGDRLPSGRPLEFWRCAGYSSEAMVFAALAPISAVAYKSAWTSAGSA